MNLMSFASLPDPNVAQLIDANLDRAREGLRVIEDWCRLTLRQKDLVVTLKGWRQQLGSLHHEIYKQARCIENDEGLGITHPAQSARNCPEDVIAANSARAQEALRVIEEFSRQCDPELSETAGTIRYGLYELETTVLNASLRFKRRKKLLSTKLCLLTDPKTNIYKTIEIALKKGVSMIQYRNKDGSDMERFSEAKKISNLCKSYESLFIVNDRIDLALAVDADGVHLGQGDLPTEIARQLIGSQKLIGRSTHCLKQLEQAESEGCDYLGVGPVHLSKNKPQEQPRGLSYVSEVSKATKLPWFAIGGINTSNLNEVLSAGAERVAVLSAIMNSSNPDSAIHELLKRLS